MSERRACAVLGVDRTSCRNRSRRPDRCRRACPPSRTGGSPPAVRLSPPARAEASRGSDNEPQEVPPPLSRGTAAGAPTRPTQNGRLAPGCRYDPAPNQRGSLEFLSDAFVDGRPFRILAVVDDFTRECLAPVADTSLPGLRVVSDLEAVVAGAAVRPCASRTTAPSSPVWRFCTGARNPDRVALHCARQPNPKRLHRELKRRLRDDLLNETLFTLIAQARAGPAAWKDDYNDVRPHSALVDLTPNEFIDRTA